MKPFDEQFDDSVRGAFDTYQEAVDPAALARLRGSLDAAGFSATAVGGALNAQGSKGTFRRVLRLAAGLLLAIGVLAVLGYYGFNRMGTGDDTLVTSTESVMGDGAGIVDSASSAASTTSMVAPPPSADIEPGISQEDASPALQSTIQPETASLSGFAIPELLGNDTFADGDLLENDTLGANDSVDSQLAAADSLGNGTLAAATDSVDTRPLTHIQSDRDSFQTPLPTGPLRAALPTSQQPAGQVDKDYESVTTYTMSPVEASQTSRASMVLGSNFNHTTDGLSDGIGLSFGALRQWQVLPRVRLVTGGLLAWNQFSLSNAEMTQQVDLLTTTLGSLNASIETETRYTTIALEIPLQGMLEVYRDGGRSLSVGAGLSSMVYLSETTVREGVQYLGEVRTGPQGEFLVNSTVRSFETREEYAAFDRIDAGRLLNLSVLYELGGTRRPIMIELFTKQPLGALTSSEITFGMTGITVRYGIW